MILAKTAFLDVLGFTAVAEASDVGLEDDSVALVVASLEALFAEDGVWVNDAVLARPADVAFTQGSGASRHTSQFVRGVVDYLSVVWAVVQNNFAQIVQFRSILGLSRFGLLLQSPKFRGNGVEDGFKIVASH